MFSAFTFMRIFEYSHRDVFFFFYRICAKFDVLKAYVIGRTKRERKKTQIELKEIKCIYVPVYFID